MSDIETPIIPRCFFEIPSGRHGLRVGVFGGSFNPPHAGHALVAQTALNHLALDEVWWMISPPNPLKNKNQLAPLWWRLRLPEEIRNDSRVRLTAFEHFFELYNTYDTLMFLRKHNPEVHLVWIMGADNFYNFHLWKNWEKICIHFPIVVIDRPGSGSSFLSSVTGKAFSFSYVDELKAADIVSMPPPAWTYVHGSVSSLSSTAIRLKSAFKNCDYVSNLLK